MHTSAVADLKVIGENVPEYKINLLTLGVHAQRGLQYLVCVSVTQHLTFHMIIRATNDTNLLSSR